MFSQVRMYSPEKERAFLGQFRFATSYEFCFIFGIIFRGIYSLAVGVEKENLQIFV